MIDSSRLRYTTTALAFIAMLTACGSPTTHADAVDWTGPAFGQDFGAVWYDGKAEMAHYRLTYPRYGEQRDGTAVAITVTEPFRHDARVKADRPSEQDYNVVKLNLVEDFGTGVYDYNLMTSVFVTTRPAHGMPAGSASKVSFSAQEWCGHAYQQALFGQPERSGDRVVRYSLNSYFDGEADRQETQPMPAGALSEDALYLWARGLAGPTLEPGASIKLPVYRSLAVQRLRHQAPAWETATLSRGETTESVSTPAGTFDCERYTAAVRGSRGERVWTFDVDATTPERRLVRVTRSDGYKLDLVAVERMPYWQLNREGHEQRLEGLELKPRPADTM